MQGTAQRFALPALGRAAERRPPGKMLRRRKLLGIAPESPASGACFVGRFCVVQGSNALTLYILTSNAIIQECSNQKAKRHRLKLRSLQNQPAKKALRWSKMLPQNTKRKIAA